MKKKTDFAAAKMVVFHVPKSPKYQRLVGRIAVRHAHLDYVLRMTIKSLTRVGVDEGLDATRYENSSLLRDRIKKIAKKELGDGAAFVKLQALMERAARCTGKRNRLLHSIVARDLDEEGRAMLRDEDEGWKRLPSIPELTKLETDIRTLVNEINEARLMGFLAEALNATAKAR